MKQTDSLVYEVVCALADTEGVDPTDLDYHLSEYIDTDVLASMEEMGDSVWMFTFRVSDHTVCVTHDGGVFVDETPLEGRTSAIDDGYTDT